MKNKSRLLDTWATWIVAFTIVALIFCFVGYFGYVLYATPKVPEPMKIVVVQDSTCNDVLYSRSQIDSILLLQQKQNRELNEQFQAVMEKKSNEDLTKNFFMVIASVLISICGFFGYKSIKDMKEGIKNSVEGLASNVAREKAQEIAAQESRKVAKTVAADLSKTIATNVSTKQSIAIATQETKSYLNENVRKIVLKHADSVYKTTLITSIREDVLKDLDGIILEKTQTIFDERFRKSEETDDAESTPSSDDCEPLF